MAGPETLALPVLAGAALTQGFGFLYGQLGEVLRRRRDDRDTRPIVIETTRTAATPTGWQPPLVANNDVVETSLTELENLASSLGQYVGRDLDGSDLQVRLDVGRLRTLLEVIFDQEFTFAGERRADGRLRVRQELGDVHGAATSLRIGSASRNIEASVIQKITTVHPDGEAIAVHIENLD